MISRRALVLSLVAAVLISLVTFRVTVATTGGFLVWSDGLAYFFHARSLVLDGNSDITNEYNEFDRRYPLGDKSSAVMESIRVNVSKRSDGSIVSPWPVGMGLVASPFYALGYGLEKFFAKIENRSPDSYGIIPQYFFSSISVAFGLLGFWATYLVCRKITDSTRSYLAALGVVCAGPAVFYVFVNPSMAHGASFGLCAIFTLIWLNGWQRGITDRTMLLLGFLLGLLIAIRLQNAIFGLMLAALVIRTGWQYGWRRFAFTGFLGFVALAPSLVALLLHSLSYGPSQGAITISQGSIVTIGSYSVHLGSPFFWDVLFSCRHGAFNWAPILAIGAIGAFWLAVQNIWAIVILVVVALHIFLIGGIGISDPTGKLPTFEIGNWNDHWKGGASFGMRYLTECTPLFGLGLAASLQLFRRQGVILIGASFIFLLIAWNGLLIMAYGLNTVSRTHCVTLDQKMSGISRAIDRMSQNKNN